MLCRRRGLRRFALLPQLLAAGNTHKHCLRRICRAAAAFVQKAFGVGFDRLPDPDGAKSSFAITDPEKIKIIYDTFGNDMENPSLHINFGVIEEPCCKASFVRGAFLAGGSVTDPEKRYHLEIATTHYSVSREAYSVLLEMGFSPKEAERKGNRLLYFKKASILRTSSPPSARRYRPWM